MYSAGSWQQFCHYRTKTMQPHGHILSAREEFTSHGDDVRGHQQIAGLALGLEGFRLYCDFLPVSEFSMLGKLGCSAVLLPGEQQGQEFVGAGKTFFCAKSVSGSQSPLVLPFWPCACPVLCVHCTGQRPTFEGSLKLIGSPGLWPRLEGGCPRPFPAISGLKRPRGARQRGRLILVAALNSFHKPSGLS
jgi:hypothetical protein